MYTVKLKNRYDEIIELTHNQNYTISGITGLNPVNATINTSNLSAMDGRIFNGSRKEQRNIVLTVFIDGDIEENRLRLYKYAPPKHPITFYFKNESRDVFIEGYVESHEIDLFENRQAAQISIICPQPAFKSIEDSSIEFSSIEAAFEFEFAIESEGIEFSSIIQNNEQLILNSGDIETGMIIELSAIGTVKNPVIYNRETRESFALNITMQESDLITINTNSGEKSVKLLRNGVETNIINYANLQNDWFILRYGDNIFTYNADEGYEFLQLKIIVVNKFEGV